jgi:immunoglobulin-binding protein 1
MSDFDDEDILIQRLDEIEDKLFYRGENERSLQTADYKQCILQLLRIQQGTKSMFSSNEASLKEYDPQLWRLLLTSYYISYCFQNCNADMNEEPSIAVRQQIREKFLNQALTHMRAFDEKMLQYKLIPDVKMRIFNDDLQNSASSTDSFQQVMMSRDVKIQRMKITKERKEKLKELHDKLRTISRKSDISDSDKENIRPFQKQYATLMFHQSLDDCKTEYPSIKQEIQMIKMFLERNNDPQLQQQRQRQQVLSQQQVPSQQTFQNVKKLSYSDSTDQTVQKLANMGINAINIEDRTNQRQEVVERMFRPFNPATMSLDEFAEQEMRDLFERQERQKVVDEERKRKDAEKKDPDDDTEEELLEKRRWDDWKDDNPKGSGNLLR